MTRITKQQEIEESRLCRFLQTNEDGSVIEVAGPAIRHPERICMLLKTCAKIAGFPKPNYATMTAGPLRVEYL